MQYPSCQHALRLLQNDSFPNQGALSSIYSQKEFRQSLFFVHPHWKTETSENVFRYLSNSSSRSVRYWLHGTTAQFCAYMPNLRLATRNAEDHASANPVAPLYRTPTQNTHKEIHTHTEAGRNLWGLQVDLFEEAPDRIRSDVRVNLRMLWEQPTHVTNAAHFAKDTEYVSKKLWGHTRPQLKNHTPI